MSGAPSTTTNYHHTADCYRCCCSCTAASGASGWAKKCSYQHSLVRYGGTSSNHAALTRLPVHSVGWYVSIGLVDIDTGNWGSYCGGMLITQTVVLTAAHVSGVQALELGW